MRQRPQTPGPRTPELAGVGLLNRLSTGVGDASAISTVISSGESAGASASSRRRWRLACQVSVPVKGGAPSPQRMSR